MKEIAVRDLKVGDILIDSDHSEDDETTLRDRVTSLTPGNGIIRYTTENGSGYFYETSTTTIEG